MNYTARDFVGLWKTDQRPSTEPPQDGDVTIEFGDDGTAKYSIYYQDRRDIVRLTYKVADANHIVTEQPAKGSPVKTRFEFERDSSLLLWFNGIKGRFLRVP
jgi:hypothetical protein